MGFSVDFCPSRKDIDFQLQKKNAVISIISESQNPLMSIFGKLCTNTIVESLSIIGTQIPVRSIYELKDALTKNTTLRDLSLRAEHFNFFEIIEAPLSTTSTLKSLSLTRSREAGYHYTAVNNGLCNGISKNNSLEALRLTRISLDRNMERLTHAIITNTALKTLKLDYANLTDPHLSLLVEALIQNPRITDLSLGGNIIGPDEAHHIETLIQSHPKITSLSLRTCEFNDHEASVIASALALNSTITNLDCTWNNIGNVGCLALAQLLPEHRSLTQLNLTHNNISSEGLHAIADTLSVNPSLTSLILDQSFADSGSITHLFKALSFNTTLLNLSLESLRKDDLNTTLIDNESSQAIQNTLLTNTTLQSLSLSNNLINLENLQMIAAGTAGNSSLTSLKIWSKENIDPINGDFFIEIMRLLMTSAPLQKLSLNTPRLEAANMTCLLNMIFNSPHLTRIHLNAHHLEESPHFDKQLLEQVQSRNLNNLAKKTASLFELLFWNDTIFMP